ncbi:ferritin family protein [Actinoplanes lobatus]|nr:ferritin family protein [Actinoplanes lobatus]MBB4753590.1 rubrerythrin [Actinoplanes lobatus]
MHDEAYAYVTYRAYASEAAHTGLGTVAKLFRKTAHQDRYEHFAELAQLTGFVRSDVDNLTETIAGEHHEATVMYPSYAQQARRDGCTAAAELFTEISGDEARHAQWFTAARDALIDPDQEQDFPVGNRVPAVSIPAGPPHCTGQTLTNLKDAMHGEAFASLKYELYAKHAQRTGHPRLAQLFTNIGSTERNEHFAEQAALAGLVQSTKENLRTAMTGEQDGATTTYPEYRDRAAQRGDVGAARLFNELARDKAEHACRLTAALAEPFLDKHGNRHP